MKRILFLLLLVLFSGLLAGRDNIVLSRRIGIENGLTSENVKCLFKDSRGFLWVGTGKGLNRFDGRAVKSYLHTPGDTSSLINNDINAICEDDQGGIIVATPTGISILSYSSGKFTNYRSLPANGSGLALSCGVQSVANYNHRIYLGLNNGLVSASPSFNEAHYCTPDQLHYTENDLKCVPGGAFAGKRSLWVITSCGLFYSENGLSFYNKYYNPFQLPVLDLDDVSSFCSTGDTACYIATSSFPGVYKFHYRPKTLQPYGFKELNDELIVSVCNPDHETILAATAYSLYAINGKTGKCSRCAPPEKTGSDLRIRQLLCDASGTIFEATNNGLYYDNFPSENPVTAIRDPHNKLTFVNPDLPRIGLLTVKKSGIDHPLTEGSGGLNVSYKDKAVTIEFAAANFIDPGKMEYAYTLEGYDCDWYYSQNRNTATYNSLPEGDYTFRVKALSKENQWESAPYQLNIHVTGPFWKTWWFYSLCFVAACLISYGAYYLRLQQMIRIQHIRNKISKDLHDDIGSALSSIAIYGEVAKKYSEERSPEALPALNSLQETTKMAMENMNDIVWSINPGNDKFIATIERLELFAYEILNAKGIKLQFVIPENVKEQKLSMQQRKNIYLICKEAIINTAKYSEARNCIIEIKYENKEITINITDDGKGIEENKRNLGGNGIINMRHRTRELEGILSIFSEKNAGTSLSLKFML